MPNGVALGLLTAASWGTADFLARLFALLSESWAVCSAIHYGSMSNCCRSSCIDSLVSLLAHRYLAAFPSMSLLPQSLHSLVNQVERVQ